MRTEQYRKIEKAIVVHESGRIWERWRYGRLLVVDEAATTANGYLRHGVLARLIEVGEQSGMPVSESEIQRRLRAGRAYPTEDQIRQALTDFKSWNGLIRAGFPQVPAPEGARPYDPRATRELHRLEARLVDTEQGTLFPLDEDETLAEVARWLDTQDEIGYRKAADGVRRREGFAELVKAVNGDLTKTLAQARSALVARDPSGC